MNIEADECKQNFAAQNDTLKPLTQHPIGSVRELWTLSYPLMLSALSGTLMIFLDRIILARYQTEAMNSAAAASMMYYAFLFGAISIAGIAEVFVGRHNGAKRYQMMGEPIWAMLWFSVYLIVPFALLAQFGSPYMVPEALSYHGVPYLKCLLFMVPVFTMVTALSAFFIGQGKVSIVTYSVALGNLLNLVLDIVFVFGVEGWIPSMGTFGAALATGLSQLAIALVLFGLFIQRSNRAKFGTGRYIFRKDTFMDCLRIGLPNSIGHITSICAWALVMRILVNVSFEHITVFTIGQSIWILFSFVTDGSQKAISAVSANLIGAKQTPLISKVFKSGVKLQMLYALLLTVPFFICPGMFVDRFLPDGLNSDALLALKTMAEHSCYWMWFAFIFDAIMWVIAGILTAAGDTWFIMWMTAFNSWMFGILPMYFIIVHLHGGPEATLQLIALFTLIEALCFYARYKSNIWTYKSLQLEPAH